MKMSLTLPTVFVLLDILKKDGCRSWERQTLERSFVVISAVSPWFPFSAILGEFERNLPRCLNLWEFINYLRAALAALTHGESPYFVFYCVREVALNPFFGEDRVVVAGFGPHLTFCPAYDIFLP